MKILAIETSCDETALAVLSVTGLIRPTFTFLSHEVASQAAFHAQFGGVFPAMAKREHSIAILPLALATLNKAGLIEKREKPLSLDVEKITNILEREPELLQKFLAEIPHIKKPKIDRIAVTVGPGLAPALWVGINFARALSHAWNIPLVPVNHMEGHVLSVLAPESGTSFKLSDAAFKMPAISLLVSGGHTEIVLVKGIGKYEMLGHTKDDAAGEAFDKVARMLGLPYPGGPQISKLAHKARTEQIDQISPLPRPMLHSKNFDFSFSGLKTAVLYLVRDMGGAENISEDAKAAIAREFEDAAMDVLVTKTIEAARKHKAKSIIVGGGVAANTELSSRLTKEAATLGIPITFPSKELSTDNAAMIALAGYFGKKVPISSKKLIAQGNMEL